MRSHRGNILFLILLAVVLFAALSYAVTSSMRGGGKDVSDEKARAYAAQIINYATLMEQTISRLMLVNDCKDTQVSFQNTVIAGYTNGSAPTQCRLFDPAGGGLSWQAADKAVLIPQSEANAMSDAGATYGQYTIPTTTCVPNMGGPCDVTSKTKDLVLGLRYLNKTTCDAINASLGASTPSENCYPASAGAGDYFAGGYYNAGVFLCNVAANRPTGCVNTGNNTGYTFYHVLLAR